VFILHDTQDAQIQTRHGHDRIVVGFITTYAMSGYHH